MNWSDRYPALQKIFEKFQKMWLFAMTSEDISYPVRMFSARCKEVLTHFLQWKLVVAQFIEHSPMNRATTILCNIDRR